MKKRVLSILCGMLACSMLFVACDKQGDNTDSTGNSTSGTSEFTSQAETATVTESTLASTTGMSTTKKKAVSTTKKKTVSTTKKKTPTPTKADSNNNNDNIPETPLMQFSSFSGLKGYAQQNKNKPGFDMFKDGKIVYPSFAKKGDALESAATNKEIAYYATYTIDNVSQGGDENPGAPVEGEVFYFVSMEKNKNHNMADYLDASFMKNCKTASYNGTTYYYAVGTDGTDRYLAFYAFSGDYLTCTMFLDPMDSYLSLNFFLEKAKFTSASL